MAFFYAFHPYNPKIKEEFTVKVAIYNVHLTAISISKIPFPLKDKVVELDNYHGHLG